MGANFAAKWAEGELTEGIQRHALPSQGFNPRKLSSASVLRARARGTALYDSNIRKRWHRVSANLGLASMPWHNVRHSAAAIMLAQGV
jgi:hypothetical protein